MLPEGRGCQGGCSLCTLSSLRLGQDGSFETPLLIAQHGNLRAKVTDPRLDGALSPWQLFLLGLEKHPLGRRK